VKREEVFEVLSEVLIEMKSYWGPWQLTDRPEQALEVLKGESEEKGRQPVGLPEPEQDNEQWASWLDMKVMVNKPGHPGRLPGRVNWASYGAQKPDAAEHFALCILAACAKARELDTEKRDEERVAVDDAPGPDSTEDAPAIVSATHRKSDPAAFPPGFGYPTDDTEATG
jgi:hypothetical protein